MDENKIILSSKENIQNIIVKGNDVLVDELIKNDSTVYGIIVDNIEQNKENIDNTINNIEPIFQNENTQINNTINNEDIIEQVIGG